MADTPFTILRDVPQTMRDGTVLRADIYLPEGGGRFPALLERTPYSKDNSPECQVGSPPFFASNGYAVVIQDVRGRFASEGRYLPFHDDGWGPNRDGYDTVEWVAAQPWCDGNVGTIGGSYAGATQYRLAPTRPPHLRAMYVRESSADYWAEWVYHGGAFELAFMLEWTVKWTYNNIARLAPDPDERARRKGILEKALGELESWQRHLPLHPNPLVEGLDDWFNEFLAHPADGPYWWQWNIAAPARRDRRPDRPPGRLVRHLRGRDAEELHGGAREGPDPGGARRPAADRRAVGARPVEHGQERPGRGRLRGRLDLGVQREAAALVRPLAPRRPECRAGGAAGPALRHGREPLAHRRRVPAPRHPRDAVVPPGRRRPHARGAGRRRGGRRLPLRPRRPGAHARRGDAQHPGRRLRPAAHRGPRPRPTRARRSSGTSRSWGTCAASSTPCPRRPTPTSWCA